MKKLVYYFLIFLFCILIITCEQEERIVSDTTTVGRLTIEGLGEYIGNYVHSVLYAAEPPTNGNYYLFLKTYDNPLINNVQILSDSVVFYVWKSVIEKGVWIYKSYNGNDQNYQFKINIYSTIDSSNIPTYSDLVVSGTVTVNFNNGIGIGNFIIDL